MTAEIPELRLYLAIVFVRLANKLDAVTMADCQILLDHSLLMMNF